MSEVQHNTIASNLLKHVNCVNSVIRGSGVNKIDKSVNNVTSFKRN